ncbi:hypothetical protein ACYCFK_00005, partial [Stutzerimonas stutzeri]
PHSKASPQSPSCLGSSRLSTKAVDNTVNRLWMTASNARLMRSPNRSTSFCAVFKKAYKSIGYVIQRKTVNPLSQARQLAFKNVHNRNMSMLFSRAFSFS